MSETDQTGSKKEKRTKDKNKSKKKERNHIFTIEEDELILHYLQKGINNPTDIANRLHIHGISEIAIKNHIKKLKKNYVPPVLTNQTTGIRENESEAFPYIFKIDFDGINFDSPIKSPNQIN